MRDIFNIGIEGQKNNTTVARSALALCRLFLLICIPRVYSRRDLFLRAILTSKQPLIVLFLSEYALMDRRYVGSFTSFYWDYPPSRLGCKYSTYYCEGFHFLAK